VSKTVKNQFQGKKPKVNFPRRTFYTKHFWALSVWNRYNSHFEGRLIANFQATFLFHCLLIKVNLIIEYDRQKTTFEEVIPNITTEFNKESF